MSLTNSSIRSSSINRETNNCISARIRRLKIQEELLLQSIKNTNNVSNDEQHFIQSCSEFKKFLLNLRNSYIDINKLFEDVKSVTKSRDLLKSLDINDLKKDVLALDEKIKALKNYLLNEQCNLKQEEEKLIVEINHITSPDSKLKMQKRVSSKTFSDIVPSPVKTLINSPLKCQEVQEFQDFLYNTNKYGGWSEYNHSIFTKLWVKHFGSKHNFTDFNCDDFELFVGDALNMVSGVKKLDIISHIKWYVRYLHLKTRKQHALAEWKNKNKALKAPHRLELVNKTNKKDNNLTKSCSSGKITLAKCSNNDEYKLKVEKNLSDCKRFSSSTNEHKFYRGIKPSERLHNAKFPDNNEGEIDHENNISYQFAKTTTQWTNKCKELRDKHISIKYNNIENIEKLGIPHWRRDLQ